MTNYVVCLKWGTKYSAEYVNKLHSMVERNLTLPYEFVCFTENTEGIDKKIRCEALPSLPLQGWWYKLWFLSDEFPLDGTILFLDLDLLVFNSIDKLFAHNKNKFCIVRDFNRSLYSNWNRFNSSVFRYESKSQSEVYNIFKKDYNTYTRKFQGDQDFMFKYIKNSTFWPDTWIQSYKWEMRGRSELIKTNGVLNFKSSGSPNIKPDTSIAVFHGKPDIHDCIDDWPKAVWH